MSQGKHGIQNPQTTDGRNISPELGELLGEGSQQIVARADEPQKAIVPYVFGGVPSEQPGLQDDPTYYDHAVIKKSPWTIDIPAYYYVGGVSGMSMALGAASLLARGQMPTLRSHSRWIGTIGALVSAGLLIHDLGRPSRFLYMLRVFRPTSPMNMGSWILTGFSTFAGAALFMLRGPRWWTRFGDVFSVLAGLFGLGLAGYTGVLVGNTVVPVWQASRLYLPVLFLSSATASAASVFYFLQLNPQEAKAVDRLALIGKAGEIASMTLMERHVAQTPEAVRPLREGVTGAVWQAGRLLSAASITASLFPGSARSRRVTSGVLGTLGALCVRFAVHYAGHRSADNPRATFHQQRAGEGAFAVTGQAAIVGPGETRAMGHADREQAQYA